MARHSGALQADCNRQCLGFDSTFLTMVISTVIFGNLAKLPSGGVPYPILIFAAILPWQFFANSLTDAVPA